MASDPFMNPSLYAEPWLFELRERFLADGHDHERVDRHIGDSLARYYNRRAHAVFPLLIERSVHRALRDNAKPRGAESRNPIQ